MRRILLLITDLEIGGTPTVVRELAVRLQRAGVHVEVVGLSRAGPLAEQLAERGVPCTALGARGTWDGRILPRLVGLLRRGRFDTVLSFLVHANALAAAARLLYPRARYFQSIQTTQPWPRWHWGVQRLIAPAARRVIVPSPSVAAVARRWSGVAAGKIAVIPNAVEVGEFAGVKENHGRAAHVTVGFIGRLDPVKRIGDLVRAMALLPAAHRLHIYGEGSERSRIEAEVARLGLGARVTLHGAVADARGALASMDVLVLPSRAEGFGLVLIEAMAAGVPVVATDVPGIRDVVRNGETGVLIPVGSPAALAAAVARVAGDEKLRGRLVGNAAADVAARFSWGRVLGEYIRVLGIA